MTDPASEEIDRNGDQQEWERQWHKMLDVIAVGPSLGWPRRQNPHHAGDDYHVTTAIRVAPTEI
jgi:hypothetical protein